MIKKKIIFLIVLQFFFNSNLVYSIENKILYKIDNEIITSIDLEDEKNYLKILNKDINSLGEERIYDIVKSSLIREKIKKIEILKNVNEIKLEEKFFETLLDNFQKRIDVYDKETFYKLLKKESINLEKLKEKFSIEVYWNELIINKFGSKVEINEKKLQNQVSKINNKEYNSFNLSEIIFDIETKKDLESKFNKIENDIETNGFENTVLIYSLADSKNFNGKLGWINEEEINKKLLNQIQKLKIGEHTKPIKIASGFLIIKLNDVKKTKRKVDVNQKLTELIKIEKNKQLNQFSNIYYNKIKKEIKIEKL